MHALEVSAEIPAPADRVWDAVVDTARWDEWMAAHNGFPNGAPPRLSVGTTFVHSMRLLAGMAGTVRWAVDSVEPNRSYTLKGDGPMGVSLTMSVLIEPLGDTSRVRYLTELSGALLTGPVGRGLAKATTETLDESLSQLRNLLS